MSINFQELRELLSAIAQTDIAELTLKSDEFELMVRKGTNIAPTATTIVTPGVTEVVPPPVPSKSVVLSNSTPETSPAPAIDKKWVEITSPMVGTFYRAPAPDESPFVDTGDRISKGQTVCIIEAMKLMNEIEAEVSGQVMEILVQNGEPVEYGQTLMWVNPD
ncbi:acetyl-CoA carboxylase, biotin carboxyl carrier protein [Stanieria cyanosphaera PCC 7437]|uniref:Biotin carboxyl carrier protein of acetyl-CoA carboxylase n=1 Tax=Stanieria cyanosphaera (strain ATCC 29371 / PCC 7437) TaxID=111780 RepID=K9Y112_STAC7|nr:acetyl-CoA carboxylase biotin carboxyl carrier protein [Stanieria cyanosphaera]AFZ37627.1 acetyl-CoA carboxylase, biotin carboxyl carrier protein [Stanieria cyanosphaera PCC 7437]